MPEEQRIQFAPSPPVQGQWLTICYDFEGVEIGQTRVSVDFKPGGEPSEHTLTPEANCVSIYVPQDAETIVVEDLDGPSPDRSEVIETG